MTKDFVIHSERMAAWANQLVKAQEDNELEADYRLKDYEHAIAQGFARLAAYLDDNALDSLFGPYPIMDIKLEHSCDGDERWT